MDSIKLNDMKIDDIELREISIYDVYDLYDILTDDETLKYLTIPKFKSLIDSKWVIENIYFKRLEENIPIGFAIVKDDTTIGIIDYHTKQGKFIELGYFLKSDYFGKGIMKKVLDKVIDYGFLKLGYLGYIIKTDTSNLRNLKLINHFHFKQFKEENNIKSFLLKKEDYYDNKTKRNI